MPEHFEANGYFTAAVGKIEHGGHHDAKWDLFDDIKGGGAGDDEGDAPAKPTPAQRQARKQAANSNDEVAKRMAGSGLPYEVERATTDENDPENADTRIAAKACKVLEAHKDQPFFIALGWHKPHVPHVAPKKYFDMYPLDSIHPAVVPPGDEKDIPPAALASRKNYQPDMTLDEKKHIIRSYYACTTYMDDMVGRVFATMEKEHLWDNTIVIFIGDHGWHFGEHNWWAKASLFEESCNAPLIIYAPGMKPAVSAKIVEFLDIYPTIADLCSLPPPPQHEGTSLAPLLKNPTLQSWQKPAYTALGDRGRTVRTDRYRYTEWNHGNAGSELYDHEKDPHEFTNLAKDPAHAQTVAEMKKLLWQVPHYPDRVAAIPVAK
jgi:iduronate 2-sulfatase